MNKENQSRWQSAFAQQPLIAILRGVTPDECVAVVQILVDEGFTMVEVPLNSPSALLSIQLLRKTFPDVLIGAGTVINTGQALECIEASCQMIVAPNFNPAVASVCAGKELMYCPGVATPSEAFAALEAGADALKLFPAELITPSIIRAMMAVLPADTVLLPVGGITPDSMAAFHQAGARGFGIGSALYRSGKSPDSLRQAAREFIAASHELCYV